jgi:RNA-directed DNA polymerase
MDNLLYQKLRRWAKRRHPKKGRGWVARNYWHSDATRNWIFSVPHRAELLLHSAQHRQKHVKVVGTTSPFDGNLVYWASRLGRHPELPAAKARLLKRQGGKCAVCGLYFTSLQDVLEVDHRTPAILGGSDVDTNHQLLHGHCHDRKTASDGSLRHMAATQRARVLRAPRRKQ